MLNRRNCGGRCPYLPTVDRPKSADTASTLNKVAMQKENADMPRASWAMPKAAGPSTPPHGAPRRRGSDERQGSQISAPAGVMAPWHGEDVSVDVISRHIAGKIVKRHRMPTASNANGIECQGQSDDG